MNLIVLHAHQVAVPAPAQGNAGVADVVNGVVVNGDAIDIPGTDSYAPPVLVGNVIEHGLLNDLSGAYLTEVGGLVGQVRLQTFGRERAADVAVHGNVGERAVADCSAFAMGNVVNTAATQMLKAATVEVDVFRIAQLYGSIGTTEPSLVVELVVVGTVNLWAQLVSLGQVHACLQGHVTFLGRTHPCGVAEGDTLDGDVAHRTLGSTDEFHQRLQHGYDGMKV